MQQTASHIKIPEIKELQINFRSHSGILNLAASVIDLMSHFFPNFFDSHLPTDKGIFPGPIPIVFVSKDIFSLFMTDDQVSTPNISFGANQVVIVRSDTAKEQLIKSKQLQGIILTIQEAKGLEFRDVLLYNMFDAAEVSIEL